MELNLTFIGEDGSMGFKHGKNYRISLSFHGRSPITMVVPRLCPYSSLTAFGRNWQLTRGDIELIAYRMRETQKYRSIGWRLKNVSWKVWVGALVLLAVAYFSL